MKRLIDDCTMTTIVDGAADIADAGDLFENHNCDNCLNCLPEKRMI